MHELFIFQAPDRYFPVQTHMDANVDGTAEHETLEILLLNIVMKIEIVLKHSGG